LAKTTSASQAVGWRGHQLGYRGELDPLADCAARGQKTNKPETPITYVGDRPGQVFRHTANASKAERLLGWKPRIRLDEGLDRTIAWYEANRPWWEKQLWMREIPITPKGGTREMH
jgi:UDP-glucose 4-epimerase